MFLYVRVTNKDTGEQVEWDWVKGRSQEAIVLRALRKLYKYDYLTKNCTFEVETRETEPEVEK